MKNKSKTKIFILSLGLIFAFLIINNYNFFNEQDEIIEIRDETNLKSPKGSGDWTTNFIHIDDNWSDTATTYDWCSGDGSWGNPYTIENVTINASSSPTGQGIFIYNSKNDFFIIRNCIVYNAGVNYDDAGIKLENTNNGALINNNCSNNVGNGILLINYCENNTISENIVNNNEESGILLLRNCENNIISKNIANDNDDGIFLWIDCINNTISGNIANNNLDGIRLYPNCNNNTISGNTANDNSQSGIDINGYCDNNIISGNYLSNEATLNQDSGIRMSSNCKNNIITRNNIKNNQYLGIYIYDLTCQDNIIYHNLLIGTGDWHARDEGTNNQWYSSGIGNYWDNHTSPDSDNDGIVDVPYTWITGSANSEDSFPLAASPLHVGDRIHIDDDGISAPTWSRTVELSFWCTGSGTYSDPYIIDGVEIDADGLGNGIYIENSKNHYFIIRNCIVYNASNGSYDAGIKLENTNNGILSNNNCSNNGGNGILLRNYCENNTISGNTANDNDNPGISLDSHCDNNTILGNTASNIMTSNQSNGIFLFFDSNNNTISGNTVIDNNGDGILLLGDCDDNAVFENIAINNKGNGIELNSDCDNNLISENTANNEATLEQNRGISITSNCKSNTISGNLIRNNLINGIGIISIDCQNNLIYQNSLIGTINCHALDDGTNNHWNSSGIGNYWDNHTSPDSDKDGIVDNSYSWITGSAGSEDFFPLAESPIHIGEKIHIDGSGVSAYNWSITAKLKMWCIGSGTYSDPYVIDGVVIDAVGSGSGILIGNSSVYFIIRNCKIFNSGSAAYDAGIKLENTNNGTLTNNNCSDNGIEGIFLYNYCNNNTIANNTANNNGYNGIYLRNYCDNNTISGNTASNIGTSNQNVGIYLIFYCDNNTISGNSVSNNTGWYGIYLRNYCDNNTISGNIANGNNMGIYLEYYCDDNTISGNTANNGLIGIDLDDCDYNTVSGNFIYENDWYGISIDTGCDGNLLFYNWIYTNSLNNAVDYGNNQWDNGTIGNYWDDYGGVDIDDDGIGDTPYDVPEGGNVDNYPIWDDGPHVIIINSPNPGDVFGATAPSFNVSIYFPIFDTSWYTLDNGTTIYTFIGSSGTINQTAWDTYGDKSVTIRFFVNNTAGNFKSAEITVFKDILAPTIEINYPIIYSVFGEFAPAYIISIEEGNLNKTWYTMDGGIINTTFTELTGIINQTLWDALPNGYVTIRFYAIDIAGDIGFKDVIVIKDVPYNLLYVEISDHSYSLERFNLTFFVFDETGQGINSATIQMWWNGIDVSNNIIDLGNGFYFVSLDPITVAPGEDPILLKMVISADGYEDKYFETHIAVDPDTLNKDGEKPAQEFPLAIIIITISSIAGGIGVIGVSIVLLRKRKRISKGI